VATLTLPPRTGKLALINHDVSHTAPDRREQQVAPLSTQEVTEPSGVAPVDPIHAIQALQDGNTALSRAPQSHELTGATDHEHRIVRCVAQFVAGLYAMRGQSFYQPQLKG
jgi:hypothetical protein